MKNNEVLELAARGFFNNRMMQGIVEETHISWVILSGQFAFKLKKPVRLPFLDFSTLALRRHYCERELILNRRFTDIYLDVIPVRRENDTWYAGGHGGTVVDHMVRMKRLRSSKRMDHVVRSGKVSIGDIRTLAKVIASFHTKAEVVRGSFNLTEARNTFNDIGVIRNLVSDKLGASFAGIIDDSIQWSDHFLEFYEKKFQHRIDSGFRRDVHGDLHSGNIFLYRKPVLFDCIEFNDAFRQIDVLYEIAFLCMEFEVLGHPELANTFISSYFREFACMEDDDDWHIFNYYKCMRANVRAKIHGIEASQMHTPADIQDHLEKVKKYLTSVNNYHLNTIHV